MTFTTKMLTSIRKEFPAIDKDPHGRKRVFLDNGAGTLVTIRSAAREAIARLDWSANVGNAFPESVGAQETILEGRKAVADFLHGEGPETIVSGESATGLLFMVAYAMAREMKGKGNVVTTGYEHYANINPWIEIGRHRKIGELRFAEFDKSTGKLDMEHLKSLIDDNTRVVTVTAASNVLGTRTDLKKVGQLAKEVGAYFVVDGVHHVAHGPTDVRRMGCDFYVFSGYKLFSRHGSFMYCTPEAMEDLKPYKVESSPKHGPEKWELGTRDQAMFAAISGAIDYLAWLTTPQTKSPPKAGPQRASRLKEAMEKIEAYERELTRIVLHGTSTLPGLPDIRGVTVYGPKGLALPTGRDPTFSFKVAGHGDRALAEKLWSKYALAVGAEDYYSRVPAVYRKKTMLRATFVHYNTKADATAFLKALENVTSRKR
jgi:selenocysteine lyase/cysteine desulfurase